KQSRERLARTRTHEQLKAFETHLGNAHHQHRRIVEHHFDMGVWRQLTEPLSFRTGCFGNECTRFDSVHAKLRDLSRYVLDLHEARVDHLPNELQPGVRRTWRNVDEHISLASKDAKIGDDFSLC